MHTGRRPQHREYATLRCLRNGIPSIRRMDLTPVAIAQLGATRRGQFVDWGPRSRSGRSAVVAGPPPPMFGSPISDSESAADIPDSNPTKEFQRSRAWLVSPAE